MARPFTCMNIPHRQVRRLAAGDVPAVAQQLQQTVVRLGLECSAGWTCNRQGTSPNANVFPHFALNMPVCCRLLCHALYCPVPHCTALPSAAGLTHHHQPKGRDLPPRPGSQHHAARAGRTALHLHAQPVMPSGEPVRLCASGGSAGKRQALPTASMLRPCACSAAAGWPHLCMVVVHSCLPANHECCSSTCDAFWL